MNLNNLIEYARLNGEEDVLAGISVPRPINAAAVRSAIVVRCGMLTPVYEEPDVFRQIVTDWFYEKQWTFNHLVNIINAEYSPIENVDEYTDYTDTGSGERTGGYTDQRSGGWTEQKTNEGGYTDTHSGGETTENTVSAENSNTYQPDNKSTLTDTKELENTHEDEDNITHTDTGKLVRTETGSDKSSNRHVGRRHGNVGVTTNQTLITEELKLLRHFDVYKYIAELFEADNMLMIY